MAPYSHGFQPTISHVRWNDQLIVNRIARWANKISHGKEDIRQTVCNGQEQGQAYKSGHDGSLHHAFIWDGTGGCEPEGVLVSTASQTTNRLR